MLSLALKSIKVTRGLEMLPECLVLKRFWTFRFGVRIPNIKRHFTVLNILKEYISLCCNLKVGHSLPALASLRGAFTLSYYGNKFTVIKN